jgi:hypothetical protein
VFWDGVRDRYRGGRGVMGFDLDDLTELERGLWEAFRAGAEMDLRVGDSAVDAVGAADAWGQERTVRGHG